MAVSAGFPKQEAGTAHHHFAAKANKGIHELLQVQQLRAAVKQRHHIDTEGRLKLGQLEEIIADRFRVSVAPELDHDTDFLRGLIPEIHNAVDLLLAPEGRDLLDQFGLVHHVGEFVHNDRRMSLVIGFVVHLGADQHGAAAGAVRLTDTAETENDAASREIRSREETDQVIHARRRVMQRVEARINCFSEVMRRDVRRHADRDTLAAIHQQLREAGGQHRRFFFCTVKVRCHIDRITVDISQHLFRNAAQTDFRVTHGSRRVAVNRAEVAVTVNERIAERERLRHTDDRVIDRDITMRVVLTDHVADHTGRLLIGNIVAVAEAPHGIKHAAVNRLETVPGVRKRTSDQHAHRVIEVGLLHLIGNIDLMNIFLELRNHFGTGIVSGRRIRLAFVFVCRHKPACENWRTGNASAKQKKLALILTDRARHSGQNRLKSQRKRP
ncbi:val start codon [Sutterella sp. CAG:351]|nr:val start codon [Sutterella sp. CAG:351]